MISHQNVISNVLQFALFEKPTRDQREKGKRTDVVLGLLPLSHIYGLVVVAHLGAYRGDEVIILPKFEMASFLNAIQEFKISSLYCVRTLAVSCINCVANGRQVPPIIIQLAKNRKVCSQYNLSSVHSIFSGAAPLGAETSEELQKVYPSWKNQTSIRPYRILHRRLRKPRPRHLVRQFRLPPPRLHREDNVSRRPGDHSVRPARRASSPKSKCGIGLSQQRQGKRGILPPRHGRQGQMDAHRRRSRHQNQPRRQRTHLHSRPHQRADQSKRPPSRPRRTRSPSPLAPRRRRLRRHPHPGRPRGRSTQGVCGEEQLCGIRGE